MQPFLRKAPVFRVLFAFIPGILLGDLADGNTALVSISILLLLLTLLVFTNVETINLRFRWMSGSVVFLLWLFLGTFAWSLGREATDKSHFSKFGDAEHYLLKLESFQRTDTNRIKSLVHVSGMLDSTGSVKPTTGRAMVYLQGAAPSDSIRIGDVLLTSVKPVQVRKKVNPWGFDYQKFLAVRNIHHQWFLDREDIEVYNNHEPSFTGSIMRFRQSTLQKTREMFSGDREFSVFSALVLGDKSRISEDVRSDYANAGTMHVLAVSGLHVGIVYLLLSFILRPLEKRRYGRYLSALLQVLAIWCFALLTGLSPSIQRASVMFTFLVLGDQLDRNHNIFNSLGISALVLLIVQPELVYSVGFQLSYLAVLGIVILYPKLNELWLAPNKVLNWAWSLVCVSIAAQLAVMPLSIYYFHQLPVYFPVINLIVIPTATVALMTGIVAVACVAIPYVPNILLKPTEWVLWLQNESIGLISSLPYSHLSGLYLDEWSTWLLYLWLTGLVVIVVNRMKLGLYLTAATTLMFAIWFSDVFVQRPKPMVTVFHHSYQKWVAVNHGNKAHVFCDQQKADSSFVDFVYKPYTMAHGFRFNKWVSKKDTVFPVLRNGNLFQVGNRSFWFYQPWKEIPPVDYMILNKRDLGNFLSEERVEVNSTAIVLGNYKNVEIDSCKTAVSEYFDGVYFTQEDGPFGLGGGEW